MSECVARRSRRRERINAPVSFSRPPVLPHGPLRSPNHDHSDGKLPRRSGSRLQDTDRAVIGRRELMSAHATFLPLPSTSSVRGRNGTSALGRALRLEEDAAICPRTGPRRRARDDRCPSFPCRLTRRRRGGSRTSSQGKKKTTGRSFERRTEATRDRPWLDTPRRRGHAMIHVVLRRGMRRRAQMSRATN